MKILELREVGRYQGSCLCTVAYCVPMWYLPRMTLILSNQAHHPNSHNLYKVYSTSKSRIYRALDIANEHHHSRIR